MSEGLSIEVQVEPAIDDAGGLPAPAERLVEAAQAAAAEAGFAGPGEMTLVIADDGRMQELNRTYRGVDATTDVLAFGAEGECEEAGEAEVRFVLPAEAGPAYLGDVVISLPQAQRQAAERGGRVEAELCLLVVHGTLHLLGYEHAGDDERRAMWETQRRALRRLGEPCEGSEPSQGSQGLASCFRCALAGIWYTVRTQRNARIHLAVTAGVALLGLWLGLDWTEWAILVLTIAVVFIAEMFNTALEATIDLACAGYHPLARIGKDVAAGAVLVGAILAVVVGLLILGPRLWAWLRP